MILRNYFIFMPRGILKIILKYQKKYREGQEVPVKLDTGNLDFESRLFLMIPWILLNY